MKAINKIAIGMAATFLLGACGELPGFTVGVKTDAFVQLPVVNDKIDLIFVVDNSGSMLQEQVNLGNSFETFINEFSGRGFNFQIGVLSTDNSTTLPYWRCEGIYSPNGAYCDFDVDGPGHLISKIGNDRILTSASTGLLNQFRQNVLLGTSGGGSEAGLLSVINFAKPELHTSGAWNSGFVRDGAFLSVIFVSDEDESRFPNPTTSHYIRVNAAEREARVNEFSSSIKALKKNDASLLRVDAVVAPSFDACPTVHNNGGAGGGYGTGDVYMQVAAAFGGKTHNICQDFSPGLQEIGKDLVKLLTRFKLAQKPTGQIEVRVDDVLIPRDPANGWEYFAETMEVEFRGTAIPSAQAKITVAYVPGAPLQ